MSHLLSPYDTPAAASTMTSLPPDITLEIFAQQPSAAVATPFLLCYKTDETVDADEIVEKLDAGRLSLHEALPWTSGEVIRDQTGPTESGVFKIRHAAAPPRVIVKDLRDDPSIPSMQELQKAEFPASMLDETIFSPFSVLPGKEPQATLRNRVLVLQANLIRGGVLLNICGHHSVLDGTGQEQVTYLLNKACQGQPLTPEEIRIGNLPRENIIELFPDDWQPVNSPYLKPAGDKPNTSWAKDENDETTSPLIWINISFSRESLEEVKNEAHRGLSTGFVSTDDALTALVWQSLCRARVPRLKQTTPTIMGRAINPRRYLDVPPTYPGYISNMAYTTKSLHSMTESTLGQVAAELRTAVDPKLSKLSDLTREFATLIHRAEDKDTVSLGNCLDLDHDLMVSSWAAMRCYEFDFGMGLGLPVTFRRTKMVPVPNLIFFLPKDASGCIVVNMCIREDDLERLQRDPEFNRYVRFIG